MQKKAVRLVFNSSYRDESSPLFHKLCTLPLDQLLEREIMKFMYKMINFCHTYSLSRFWPIKQQQMYHFRGQVNFIEPFVRSVKLSRQPLFSFPSIWNNSDFCLKDETVYYYFKEMLELHYFSIQQFNTCENDRCKICNHLAWKIRQDEYIKSFVRPSIKPKFYDWTANSLSVPFTWIACDLG